MLLELFPLRAQTPAPLVEKVLTLGAIVGAIGTFAYYATALYLKYPPVWPDEALIADAAINLLRRGVMGSYALAGTFPGIERHTYLNPPLYYVYLAGWLHLWGPRLIVMKLSSLAAGAAVMLTTYFLGVKSGLSPWLSLVPPSLVAVDSLFLRAALLVRPDMLALDLILLALLVATYDSPPTHSLSPGTAFIAGLIGGLAMLTHPIGIAAALAVLSSSAISTPRGARVRVLLPILGGVFLSLLPWGFYISGDPKSFLAQFAGQLARKSAGQPLTLMGLGRGIALNLSQYGLPLGVLAALMWGAGVIGVCDAARSRRGLLVLPICQILLLPVITIQEIWYPIYLLPLTALGVTHLALRTKSKLSRDRIDGLLTVALIVCFVFGNILRLSRMRAARDRGDTDYWAWCAKVGALIPHGSKVLLSVIPDPYFGLMSRSDIQLREFLPEKIPIDPRKYSRYIGEADYIVVGELRSPSPVVADFASSNGQLVGTVGRASSGGYCARIYKLPKEDSPSSNERNVINSR